MMLVNDLLSSAKAAIEHYVKTEVVKETGKLGEALRYITDPLGKCIRGFLVLETSRIFALPSDRAIAISTAVELLHTYSLVHDDLPAMDDSSSRRGKLCCHLQFDEATALLAGNHLMSTAFGLLSKSSSPEVVQLFTNAINRLIAGQHSDINYNYDEINIEQVMELYRQKTAELFRVSCIAAPIGSGADKDVVESLSAYGTNIGIAFQLLDDVDDQEFPTCLGKSRMVSMASNLLLASLQSLKQLDSTLNTHHLIQIVEYFKERCEMMEDHHGV